MKQLIGVLGLCSLALSSQAQDTQEVTRNYQNPFAQERYSVLKADPSVKQGAYERRVGQRSSLAESGYYRQGAKDSVWVYYHWDGKTPMSRGRYRHDQRVGVWEAYNYNGELVQQYDYTQRRLLLNKPGKGAERITARPLAAGTTLSAAPVYLGGYDAVNAHIGRQVRYPMEALRRQIGGEVRIAFTVAADGSTANYHVAKGIGGGCDEEALRTLQQLPGEWVPAQADGQPVAAEVEVPVTFTIK